MFDLFSCIDIPVANHCVACWAYKELAAIMCPHHFLDPTLMAFQWSKHELATTDLIYVDIMIGVACEFVSAWREGQARNIIADLNGMSNNHSFFHTVNSDNPTINSNKLIVWRNGNARDTLWMSPFFDKMVWSNVPHFDDPFPIKADDFTVIPDYRKSPHSSFMLHCCLLFESSFQIPDPYWPIVHLIRITGHDLPVTEVYKHTQGIWHFNYLMWLRIISMVLWNITHGALGTAGQWDICGKSFHSL